MSSYTLRNIRQIKRLRVLRTVCRHCGGRLPCWSEFGDYTVGRKHTRKTWTATQKEKK